jgi:hypothetical protein
MALKAAARKRIPSSKFAYPKARKYPIDTPARARAALRYAGQKRTYGSYSHVAAAVRRRYGSKISTKGRPRRRK